MKKEGSTFFNVSLDIDVKNNHITVDMEMDYYIVEETKTKKLTFLLNRNFAIANLSGSNINEFTFDKQGNASCPFMPEAGILEVYLKEPVLRGDIVPVKLQYSGTLHIVQPWGDNRLTEEWIELGLYFPWFPYNLIQLESKNITYCINVKIDHGYKVFGLGTTTKEGDYWQIKNLQSDVDMIVMAAKALKQKSIEENGLSLEISYTKTDDSIITDILNTSIWIINKFQDWFGDTKLKKESIVIAYGGGYVRRNFIVLDQFYKEKYIKKQKDNFKYLAHEFSHLWWSNAPSNSWEDWLNESFAEYSAVMAVREKFGQEVSERIIIKKRHIIQGLPPIKGINRGAKDAYGVLYNKGCVLLSDLELQIGKATFMRFLQQLIKNKVSSTDQCLKILSNVTNSKISEEFDRKLRVY